MVEGDIETCYCITKKQREPHRCGNWVCLRGCCRGNSEIEQCHVKVLSSHETVFLHVGNIGYVHVYACLCACRCLLFVLTSTIDIERERTGETLV